MNKSSVQAITRAVEQQIISAGGTKAGADWAIQTLDPFHDVELPDCNGAPNGSGLPVVHQCIRQQITIRKPAAITTAGWDCHIVNFPFLDPAQFQLGSLVESATTVVGSGLNDYTTPIFAGDTNPKLVFGGVTAFTGPVGFDSTNPYYGLNTNQVTQYSINPPNVFTKGSYRVSASAFEVRSVGPELYRSGTCNMWQLPVPDVSSAVSTSCYSFTTATQNGLATINTVIMDAWPGTESAAMVIPSTVTGAAIDGAYVVSRMNTLYPRIIDGAGHNFIMRAPSQTTWNNITNPTGDPNGTLVVTPSYGPGFFRATMTVGGTGTFTPFLATAFTVGEFDLNGAQFLGLSDTDVLTITVKWYITRYPSENQLEILVSQKAAPRYDPIAFEWYSKHASLLPSGVRVRDNALGDWFRSVVGTVKDTVSRFAPMASGLLSMAGPKGKAAAALLNSVAGTKRKQTNTDKQVNALSKEVKRMKVSNSNPMTKKVKQIVNKNKRNR